MARSSSNRSDRHTRRTPSCRRAASELSAKRCRHSPASTPANPMLTAHPMLTATFVVYPPWRIDHKRRSQRWSTLVSGGQRWSAGVVVGDGEGAAEREQRAPRPCGIGRAERGAVVGEELAPVLVGA